MSETFAECVALDTNVFLHLLNPQQNDGHIDELLMTLMELATRLLVDQDGHIAHEYLTYVVPRIQDASDTGPQTSILRYWMDVDRRISLDIPSRCNLWRLIQKVIHEQQERTDCRFVCVAFLRQKALVTNDRLHILEGPTREHRNQSSKFRLARLLKIAKDERLRGAAIFSTREAAGKCARSGR